MRTVRFEDAGGARGYAVERAGGYDVLSASPLAGGVPTGRRVEPVRLLAPIEPTAILGIGLNYRAHAAESGRPPPEWPMVFFKLPSCAVGPGAPIVLPRQLASEAVDAEAELAVVIGKDAYNVTAAQAHEYIAGYTCANDVSARDWQFERGGGQFCRGKMFATFCPLGPVMVTPDEFGPVGVRRLRGHHNGEVVQDSLLDDLLFDVPTLIAFLSGSTVLPAGSVILTGTPSGVGFAAKPPRYLQPGDITVTEIEGIGRLENPVIAEG